MNTQSTVGLCLLGMTGVDGWCEWCEWCDDDFWGDWSDADWSVGLS